MSAETNAQLGSDEVRLVTGEVVKFRLVLKPNPVEPGTARVVVQTSKPLRFAELRTPNAAKLAHLRSVLLDLTFARECCERLPGNSSDAIASGALWRAALIAYRRCFTTGTRTTRLSAPTSTQLAKDHSAFLGLATGHIAHQIDRFEAFQVFALGTAPPTAPLVVGVHVLGVSHQLGSADEIQRLTKLAKAVEQTVQTEVEATTAEVLHELQSRDPNELFSRPLGESKPLSRIGSPTKAGHRRKR